MSPSLFLLAEASGPVTKILGDFGISLPLLLAQIVNFSIVAFLLWRFAFKPVMATIDERKRQIDAGLRYTEEMKAKLAAAEQTTAAQLKEAQLKGQQLVAEAQKAAKEFSDKQQKEAAERANDLVAKARAAIELEKQKMLGEARTEISRLVVDTTQRVLAKELSELERARFNEAAARDLAETK